MIFVTVGLHRQGFERLIKKIDILARDSKIENIFIQTGYSNYIPKYCKWENFLSPDRMKKLILESKAIITHAGAGTIMTVMKESRLPIIVPRLKEYKEHKNNHQLDIANRMEKDYKAIVVWDINKLDIAINNYLERDISYNYQKNSNIIFILQEFINRM